MLEDIKFSIANRQLPSDVKVNKHQLPIEVVDKLADELVAEFNNPAFRKWYCRLIYSLGASKVYELRVRAREGKDPARLFSAYAKEALPSREVQDG